MPPQDVKKQGSRAKARHLVVNRGAVAFTLVMLITMMGCGTPGGAESGGSMSGRNGGTSGSDPAPQAPSASDSGGQMIDQLNLMVAPAAINIDDVPGADAIPVRVFFMHGADARVQPMSRGELDFLLFDGRVNAADVAKTAAIFSWSFTPAELSRFRGTVLGQTSYEMTLRWDKSATPKAATVTLVARYRPYRGVPVYSSATLVSMGSR